MIRVKIMNPDYKRYQGKLFIMNGKRNRIVISYLIDIRIRKAFVLLDSNNNYFRYQDKCSTLRYKVSFGKKNTYIKRIMDR